MINSWNSMVLNVSSYLASIWLFVYKFAGRMEKHTEFNDLERKNLFFGLALTRLSSLRASLNVFWVRSDIVRFLILAMSQFYVFLAVACDVNEVGSKCVLESAELDRIDETHNIPTKRWRPSLARFSTYFPCL